jgi:hypothetical protein
MFDVAGRRGGADGYLQSRPDRDLFRSESIGGVCLL